MIVLKKPWVFLSLLLLNIIAPTLICKALTQTEILNNNSLSSETAINNNHVVMISYIDSLSSLTHSDMEIYNINRLDDFMENVRNGKKDTVRIVKYVKDKDHMWVNKLEDLSYDGKEILGIAYDTYSNPDVFIPAQPTIFNNIIRRDYKDNTWYGACYSKKKGNSCATLISFLKISNVTYRNISTFKSKAKGLDDTVTYPLHFISREETYDVNIESPIIPDINLIIIDSNGKIFGRTKTGKDGVADITVTVPLDKKYNSQIGTVTVIGFNNAKYKRTVMYEVPVAGGGPLNQNIYMSPRTGYRDEAAIITYGNMYHYFSKDLADKYAPWKK